MVNWFGRGNKPAESAEVPKAVQEARAEEASAAQALTAATARRVELERDHGIQSGTRPSREPVGKATERLRSRSERSRSHSERE